MWNFMAAKIFLERNFLRNNALPIIVPLGKYCKFEFHEHWVSFFSQNLVRLLSLLSYALQWIFAVKFWLFTNYCVFFQYLKLNSNKFFPDVHSMKVRLALKRLPHFFTHNRNQTVAQCYILWNLIVFCFSFSEDDVLFVLP